MKFITNTKKDIVTLNRNYINEHVNNVRAFGTWLIKNCPILFKDVDVDYFLDLLFLHDRSKFSQEEFMPYANKWFGDGIKTPEYEEAWRHHWASNPHHPEYWQGKDIEYIYILEMICDWGSFGVKSGDNTEIFSFYETKAKNDPEKNLSSATKEKIEFILEQIKKVI